MKKQLATIGYLAMIGCLVAGNSFAALDFTGVTVNTTDVEAVMGIVIPGLAALWGFRKVVKTINRS